MVTGRALTFLSNPRMVWELVWERFWGRLVMAYGFSVFERLKDVRISGWARLWIVVFGLFWAFSAWSNVAVERENWRTVCDWAGCPSYPEQKWPGVKVVPFNNEGSRRSPYSSVPVGRSDRLEVTAIDKSILQFPAGTRPEVTARTKVEYDKSVKTQATDELRRRQDLRSRHFQRLAMGILLPAMNAVLAFVLAMLAKAAVLWIWRGFNAPKEG